MQFWPPDDEHMCSKHVEAWNKLIVKEKFCASIWLITEINSEEFINTTPVDQSFIYDSEHVFGFRYIDWAKYFLRSH